MQCQEETYVAISIGDIRSLQRRHLAAKSISAPFSDTKSSITDERYEIRRRCQRYNIKKPVPLKVILI
jgi:hypothetical protein